MKNCKIFRSRSDKRNTADRMMLKVNEFLKEAYKRDWIITHILQTDTTDTEFGIGLLTITIFYDN